MPISGIGAADIALSNMSQVKVDGIETPTDVGMAVLSNAMDQSQAAGAGMVRMMEQSVNPSVGGNIDFYA